MRKCSYFRANECMFALLVAVRKVDRLLINNKSMVPSTCKLEVQKTNEFKITRANGQKTSLKSPLYFKRGARLTGVSSESVREGNYEAPCMTTIRKLLFHKWDAYNLDTE